MEGGCPLDTALQHGLASLPVDHTADLETARSYNTRLSYHNSMVYPPLSALDGFFGGGWEGGGAARGGVENDEMP